MKPEIDKLYILFRKYNGYYIVRLVFKDNKYRWRKENDGEIMDYMPFDEIAEIPQTKIVRGLNDS